MFVLCEREREHAHIHIGYIDLHADLAMWVSKCVCPQPACVSASVYAPLKVVHPVIAKRTDKSLLKHLR